MRLVRSYLEIQKERLGDRLCYTVKMAEAVRSVPVPAFSIQTLVENSSKHAIEPCIGGGTVHIDARSEGATLVLEVIDNGPGFPTARWSLEAGSTICNLDLLYCLVAKLN